MRGRALSTHRAGVLTSTILSIFSLPTVVTTRPTLGLAGAWLNAGLTVRGPQRSPPLASLLRQSKELRDEVAYLKRIQRNGRERCSIMQ